MANEERTAPRTTGQMRTMLANAAKGVLNGDLDIDKAIAKTRLAKLNGAIGIIQVGCATSAERKELRFRLEDAILAIRAAQEEGVVVGGGLSLKSIYIPLFKIGRGSILRPMLQESLNQLCFNAGKNTEDIIKKIEEKQKEKNNSNIGYNVRTDKFEDLLAAGVIDATKATTLAVRNAFSVVGLLLNVHSFVCLEKVDENLNLNKK